MIRCACGEPMQEHLEAKVVKQEMLFKRLKHIISMAANQRGSMERLASLMREFPQNLEHVLDVIEKDLR